MAPIPAKATARVPAMARAMAPLHPRDMARDMARAVADHHLDMAQAVVGHLQGQVRVTPPLPADTNRVTAARRLLDPATAPTRAVPPLRAMDPHQGPMGRPPAITLPHDTEFARQTISSDSVPTVTIQHNFTTKPTTVARTSWPGNPGLEALAT